jgi:hypothetical protein
MKKVLMIAAAVFFAIGSLKAQNVQLHYDAGRDQMTTTIEMFRPDGGGSTFFFVDLDYSPKVTGAYFEISREFCFWQDSDLKWLSAHLEYNGGSTLLQVHSTMHGWLERLIQVILMISPRHGHLQHLTRLYRAQRILQANVRCTISRSREYGILTSSTIGSHSTDSLTSGEKCVSGKVLNSYS